jgi:hypothetical protein
MDGTTFGTTTTRTCVTAATTTFPYRAPRGCTVWKVADTTVHHPGTAAARARDSNPARVAMTAASSSHAPLHPAAPVAMAHLARMHLAADSSARIATDEHGTPI